MDNSESTDWRVFFDRYGSKMLLFAKQFSANQADAEDIVQEAFTRFWKSDRRAQGNPASLLFGCVRWAALDLIRRDSRRRKREALSSAYDRTGMDCHLFERTVEKSELAAGVPRSLESLSDVQRQVVVLKIWGELTFDQIGEALGISANTASSRYRYALGALRRTLRNENDAN